MKRFLTLFFAVLPLACAQVKIDAGDVKGTLSEVRLSNAGAADPDFTVVVIPDSQNLTETAEAAAVLNAQIQWAATNKVAQNIKAVVSVGDITNMPDADRMGRAVTAYNLAKVAGIPVVPILGNHDYDGSTPLERDTVGFNTYFGPSYFNGQAYYGTSTYPPATNDNYYVTFVNGATTYLVLALEFYPRAAAVTWARGVIEANPSAYVIITTHAFLNYTGKRAIDGDEYGPDAYGLSADNDAEELHAALVRPYGNVRMVLNGHFLGATAARASDVSTSTGVVAHQLFTNYQTVAAANHYMLILRFQPALGKITASYYSPSLAQDDPANPAVELPITPVPIDGSMAVSKDQFVGRDLRVRGRGFFGEGELSLAAKIATVGRYDTTFTFTGPTGVTFPTAGTLATRAGVEAFTNKSFSDLTHFASAGLEHVRIANRFSVVGSASLHITNNAHYLTSDNSFHRTAAALATKASLMSDGSFRFDYEPTGAIGDVLLFNTAKVSWDKDGNTTILGFVGGVEQASSPAAPAANGYLIYAKDNGAGKTVLYVRFATGAEQQLAIEP